MARPNNPSRVYFDSCTLITAVTKTTGYEPIQEVLSLAMNAKLTVVISALTYVEVRGEGRGKPVDQEKD